jgi:hypothetical protein
MRFSDRPRLFCEGHIFAGESVSGIDLMDWTSFQQVQRGNLAAAAALSAPSHFLHIRRAPSSAGSEELR